MTNQVRQIIEKLREISNVDQELKDISIAKAKLEQEIESLVRGLDQAKVQLTQTEEIFKTKENAAQKENTFLKEEEEKLIERRKVLSTFSDYKVQQSALKEIEQTTKQLKIREAKLLEDLEEVANLEKEYKEIQEHFEKLEKETQEKIDKINKELANIVDQESILQEKRESLFKNLDNSIKQQYNRLSARFPGDAIVPITNNACGGCFMAVVPQVMLRAAQGYEIVRCRGCGRILFIDEENNDIKTNK